jgi:hypothetical protein
MPEQTRILAVVPVSDDGLIVTFSDGTTAAFVVEELLELRLRREATLTSGISVPLSRAPRRRARMPRRKVWRG